MKNRSPRRPRIETLGARQLLASDLQNFYEPADVTDSLSVTPLDALTVINRLRRQQAASIPVDELSANDDGYLDVNGNGVVSPADALAVINALRRSGGSIPIIRLAEDTGPGGEILADGLSSRWALVGNLDGFDPDHRLAVRITNGDRETTLPLADYMTGATRFEIPDRSASWMDFAATGKIRVELIRTPDALEGESPEILASFEGRRDVIRPSVHYPTAIRKGQSTLSVTVSDHSRIVTSSANFNEPASSEPTVFELSERSDQLASYEIQLDPSEVQRFQDGDTVGIRVDLDFEDLAGNRLVQNTDLFSRIMRGDEPGDELLRAESTGTPDSTIRVVAGRPLAIAANQFIPGSRLEYFVQRPGQPSPTRRTASFQYRALHNHYETIALEDAFDIQVIDEFGDPIREVELLPRPGDSTEAYVRRHQLDLGEIVATVPIDDDHAFVLGTLQTGRVDLLDGTLSQRHEHDPVVSLTDNSTISFLPGTVQSVGLVGSDEIPASVVWAEGQSPQHDLDYLVLYANEILGGSSLRFYDSQSGALVAVRRYARGTHLHPHVSNTIYDAQRQEFVGLLDGGRELLVSNIDQLPIRSVLAHGLEDHLSVGAMTLTYLPDLRSFSATLGLVTDLHLWNREQGQFERLHDGTTDWRYGNQRGVRMLSHDGNELTWALRRLPIVVDRVVVDLAAGRVSDESVPAANAGQVIRVEGHHLNQTLQIEFINQQVSTFYANSWSGGNTYLDSAWIAPLEVSADGTKAWYQVPYDAIAAPLSFRAYRQAGRSVSVSDSAALKIVPMITPSLKAAPVSDLESGFDLRNVQVTANRADRFELFVDEVMRASCDPAGRCDPIWRWISDSGNIEHSIAEIHESLEIRTGEGSDQIRFPARDDAEAAPEDLIQSTLDLALQVELTTGWRPYGASAEYASDMAQAENSETADATDQDSRPVNSAEEQVTVTPDQELVLTVTSPTRPLLQLEFVDDTEQRIGRPTLSWYPLPLRDTGGLQTWTLTQEVPSQFRGGTAQLSAPDQNDQLAVYRKFPLTVSPVAVGATGDSTTAGGSVVLAGIFLKDATVTVDGIPVPVEDLTARYPNITGGAERELAGLDLVRIHVPEGVTEGALQIVANGLSASLAPITPWWSGEQLDQSADGRFDETIPVFGTTDSVALQDTSATDTTPLRWQQFAPEPDLRFPGTPFHGSLGQIPIATKTENGKVTLPAGSRPGSVTLVREASEDLYRIIFVAPEIVETDPGIRRISAVSPRVKNSFASPTHYLTFDFGETRYVGPMSVRWGSWSLEVDYADLAVDTINRSTIEWLSELDGVSDNIRLGNTFLRREGGDNRLILTDQQLLSLPNGPIKIETPWSTFTIPPVNRTQWAEGLRAASGIPKDPLLPSINPGQPLPNLDLQAFDLIIPQVALDPNSVVPEDRRDWTINHFSANNAPRLSREAVSGVFRQGIRDSGVSVQVVPVLEVIERTETFGTQLLFQGADETSHLVIGSRRIPLRHHEILDGVIEFSPVDVRFESLTPEDLSQGIALDSRGGTSATVFVNYLHAVQVGNTLIPTDFTSDQSQVLVRHGETVTLRFGRPLTETPVLLVGDARSQDTQWSSETPNEVTIRISSNASVGTYRLRTGSLHLAPDLFESIVIEVQQA